MLTGSAHSLFDTMRKAIYCTFCCPALLPCTGVMHWFPADGNISLCCFCLLLVG